VAQTGQRLADGTLSQVVDSAAVQITADVTGGRSINAMNALRTLATGNQVLLAGQKSGVVYGLDPDHGGEIQWQTKIGDSGAAAGGASGIVKVGPPGVGGAAGGVAWGSAADHRNLYVAISGLLAQPANSSGSLTALDMKTGAARWHASSPEPVCAWAERSCSHAQSQAVTVMPGSAFSGSMDGHLRAYSTIDGKILWDFDTAKEVLVMTGHPVGRQGTNEMTGSKITFYVDSDLMDVDNVIGVLESKGQDERRKANMKKAQQPR